MTTFNKDAFFVNHEPEEHEDEEDHLFPLSEHHSEQHEDEEDQPDHLFPLSGHHSEHHPEHEKEHNSEHKKHHGPWWKHHDKNPKDFMKKGYRMDMNDITEEEAIKQADTMICLVMIVIGFWSFLFYMFF
jgi:hypothetical protein